MKTKIKIDNGAYKLTIPISDAYENINIRNFIDYIKAEQILSKSQASDDFIQKLSDEVKETWRLANKDKFI